MSVGSDTVTPIIQTLGGGLLERFFKFTANGTTLRRDTLAGLTTFMVMAYIIFVNPTILSFAGIPSLAHKGLPFAAVLTSTCLVAAVMTLVMGLFSNRACALAPGLGINAVVAFSLVAAGGLTMPQAIGIVVMEGIVITILVLTGLRTATFRAIPLPLKKAIAIGIGFFILFIGLINGGVVIVGSASSTPVLLGDLIGVPVAVTLIGVGGQAGYLDKDGDLPQVVRPLVVDSIAAIAGGVVSSSATTYIESGSGVGVGGRTGWVGVIVAVLFAVSMFFSPIAGVVPANATAPALIIVGFMMMRTLTEGEGMAGHEDSGQHKAFSGIDFDDISFGLPAVLIITIMPLTYSITNGIGAGFIAYCVTKIAQGKAKAVSWMMYAASIGFLIYFAFPFIRKVFNIG